jgi:hypothetical protein
MLIASLVVLNIPMFLLIGWVVFDDHETAAETTIDAVWQAIVRAMLPWWMANFILGEDADPFAMLWLAFFVIACIAAVYAEYRFIVWLFPGFGAAAG